MLDKNTGQKEIPVEKYTLYKIPASRKSAPPYTWAQKRAIILIKAHHICTFIHKMEIKP